MLCTVIWVASASNDLALYWVQSPDRQAVTNAANRIDRLLRTSAATVGEEFGTERRLVEYPIEVIYEVIPDDRLVRVLYVSLLA